MWQPPAQRLAEEVFKVASNIWIADSLILHHIDIGIDIGLMDPGSENSGHVASAWSRIHPYHIPSPSSTCTLFLPSQPAGA